MLNSRPFFARMMRNGLHALSTVANTIIPAPSGQKSLAHIRLKKGRQ